MNFPNLSTFIAQGLSISAAFFGFKPDNAEFTCPSTKDINEKIIPKIFFTCNKIYGFFIF